MPKLVAYKIKSAIKMLIHHINQIDMPKNASSNMFFPRCVRRVPLARTRKMTVVAGTHSGIYGEFDLNLTALRLSKL